MENNFVAERETAPTLCMEAVILSGGEGERRRRAARSMCLDNHLPLTPK
jgi:hypothetical protein